MDKRSKHLMDYISKAIVHPDVSGFEALELLDVRSRLASREPLLDEPSKAGSGLAHSPFDRNSPQRRRKVFCECKR